MPISLPADGDTDWGPEVRSAITAVNDLETSPRVKVSEAPLSLLDPRVACTLDGTGDQAAKIATAISLLPAAGGAIYQPPGILRTGAITLTKPVRWFGAGDQASTIKAAASFTGTLFTIADTAPFSRVSDVQFDGGTTAVYLLKVASARTRLDHLHFTGQAGASGAALWFNGVSSNSSAHAAQCSDIRVIGCTGYAALLQGFAYDNEFTNFWAGTCNVGIRIENTNAFFTNTHIWGMTGNGVELRDGNHLFTNTYVETCGGSGFNLFNAHRVKISNSNLWKNQGHGVSLATSDRCSVIGCNIYDNGGNGVNATDSVYGQVIGNTLYEDTSSVQTQDRPVVTSGTSDKWVVTGNVMLTSEHAVGGVSMSGSNNIIDDNIVTIPLDTNATDAQLRDRATHTGTQTATTISDFAETVDDRVNNLIVAGANITKTYDDTAGTLTIAAASGGGGGGEVGYTTLQNEGTAVTNRAIMNFVGPGVNVTDNAGASKTTITIPGVLLDVKDYGATGDGSTDDTVAIQAAFNAAMVAKGSTVYFSAPTNFYRITDTIKLYNAASSENQYVINVLGNLNWNGITYQGTGNKPVFDSRGLKHSTIVGLNVTVQASVTGVTIWNLDAGVFGAVNYTSTAEVDFSNCWFSTNAAGAGIIGWRTSYSSNSADVSQVTWRNCNVFGDMGSTAGSRISIGWQSCGSNTLNLSFYACSTAFCAVSWTTIPGAGSAGTHGGDCYYWYGCGGSYNDIDFQLKTTGMWVIVGGRWEEGRQLLSCPNGGTYNGLAIITMIGVKVETYTLTSGRLIDIGNSVALTLEGCMIRPHTATTASLITVGCSSDGFGAITVQGCCMPVDCPDPFITVTGGTWLNKVRQCVRSDSGNNSTSIIDHSATIPANSQTGTTYTLIAADAGRAVEMNNASANTVTIPPNSSVPFSIGTELQITQIGAGATSVAQGSGVTLRPTSPVAASGQWGTIRLRKRGTNEWVAG